MKTPRLLPLATLLPLFVAAFGVSCSSMQTAVPEPPVVEVYKGMKAEGLVEALGQPDEVVAVEKEGEQAEIWVYRKIDEEVEMKIVSSETYALSSMPNPLVGSYSVGQYEPEIKRYVHETLFLMVDGVMVAWKQRERADEG